MQPAGVSIREAGRRDLPALTAIYNHYVETSHVTFDTSSFTVEQRAEWFDHYAPTGPHRLLVAERRTAAQTSARADGAVVGYATSSPLRPKPAYRTSVETSVYVHPNATGQGLGRRLYDELLAALSGENVHRAYAGIAVPNDASVALHLKCGFTYLGTYHEVGFKHGRYIDVEWYERAI